MTSLNSFVYKTPLGPVTITSNANGLTSLVFSFGDTQKPSALTNQAANELLEYLAGKRRVFSVALDPEGTAFQKEVWRIIQSIPYGETKTCSEIAEILGSPTAYKSVSIAAQKNPLPVFIPCHRVANAAGEPLGKGLEANHRLKLREFEQLQVKKAASRH